MRLLTESHGSDVQDWHAEEVSVVKRLPSTRRNEVGMTLVMEGCTR